MRARIGPITAPSLSAGPLRIGPSSTMWPSMLQAAGMQPGGTRWKAMVYGAAFNVDVAAVQPGGR
jgi:hypothetical protein